MNWYAGGRIRIKIATCLGGHAALLMGNVNNILSTQGKFSREVFTAAISSSSYINKLKTKPSHPI